MLSTPQKFSKPTAALFWFFFLALLQWPASYLIQNVSLPLGILINEWIFVAGIPLWIAWKTPTPLATLFPFKPVGKRPFFLVCVMTLSLVVIIDNLTFLSEKIIPPPPAVKTMLDNIMTVGSFSDGLWRWFLICLTPAFCEEIFFRGFFQKTLSHHWGAVGGLWTTALAFMLIHGIPWYWHLYFILGFYLSWLLAQSNNLWFPILAHLINNSWTFLNHVLGNKIPSGESWQATDSLVMIVCVAVFATAAFRFNGACAKDG